MKRRAHPTNFLLVLVLVSFFLNPSPSLAQTAEQYINSGEEAFFSQRIQGMLQAYSIFQQAKNSYQNDPMINVYLALTRMVDLGLRTNGTGLTDLLGRYGIVRTGVDLESLDFTLPITADERLSLPESSPPGETLRSFASGEALAALNASISNLDTTIAQWSDASKYIIRKARLDSDWDIELDLGDLFFFRAGLKAAKAKILIGTAYDQNVDLREVAALINLEVFNPKEFLDRYQSFLKLLPTATTTGNGATQLNEARSVLLSAIDDYLTASTKIRNDTSTAPGAEELIEIEPGDAAEEQLFRENLTELKNSLNENRVADLVLERIGSQYYVYGGTSFTTTEPFWWLKGYHPENYGYTFLGSASATATFSGSYPYYILVTRPGNVAPVDTVRGSNTVYYGTNTTGNVSSWGNIGGPPDNSFGLIGNKDSEGFIVINPPVNLSSITVIIVPEGTAPYPSEEHLSVNLNPFFANKPHLRDLLPSFSEYGFDINPIAGTMGHGLGNDPTLGGLFPGMTHDDWDFDILATGTLAIPTATINVQDSSVADWGSISPVLTDRTGDGDPGHLGSDLQYLYLAKDSQFLYVRMTLADGPPNTNTTQNPWQALGYFVQFRKDPNEFYGNRVAQADYLGNGTWRVQVFERDYAGSLVFQNTYQGYAQPVGNNLEWKVPLSDMGFITGKTLATWIKWIPYGGDYDQNHTTLRVGPLSSVSGTLTIPAYDGTGPIYVGAFRHDGTFSTDRDHLLGMTILYPGQYTAGMTYTISGLPVGEQAFIVARWDADFNGIQSGGDYLTRSNPLTVASDGTATANLTATTVSSREEGPPYFAWVNVQSFNGPEGIQTCLATTVADSDGSVPYTVKSLTVSGPSGFSLAFNEGDYLAPPMNVYSQCVAGQPAAGEYTFTLTDEDGNTATNSYYLNAVNVLPLPDSTTLRAYGSGVTPTLSWSPLSNYQGNLFYRARIYDMAGNIIWTSGYTTQTLVTVPAGFLTSGVPYQWRLEALDGYTYQVVNNRAVTEKVPLVIESSKPYFDHAHVYSRVYDASGQAYTCLEINLVDPNGSLPSSIQSIAVSGPNNFNEVVDSTHYLPSWGIYWKTVPGLPAEGVYQFLVTDTELKTATSYDYVKPVSLPRVAASTAKASGNSLTPTLSWGVPAGIDRPVYFRVVVEDMDGNRKWASEWFAETYTQVPSGYLESGGSYRWLVRLSDSGTWGHGYAETLSDYVTLAVDNVKPFFKWAAAYKLRDSTGVYTALSASVSDPNGTLPGTIQSLTVTGPGGFSQNLKNGTYSSQFGEFYLSVSGAPQPGVYTFTVQDTEGNTAVSYDYVGAGLDIPLVDNMSILLTGNPLAPTVSWKNVAGYPGQLYYRVRVFDLSGNTAYLGSREPGSVFTLPTGYLQPGEGYTIRIEAQDHRNWVVYNSRSNSSSVYYEVPQEIMTAVSGRVKDLEGRPIGNVMVQAFTNRCSGTPVGTAWTQDDGEYRIENLPVGQVFVRACAGCTHVGYADEWFDWNEGAYDCNGATPILLVQNQIQEGIDFSLQSAPRRLRAFEVVVSNGSLNAFVGVQPGYKNQLVNAVLSMPNPARGTYEFVMADQFGWDSDCRYIQGWNHSFGEVQSADYGDYTLTMTFTDGAQEIYHWSLKQANVTAVDPNSIQALVNDDGSVRVNWTMPTGINQYYEVRVRDAGNEEIYKSGQFKNADHVDISAYDLRCLEKGVTYRWLVRVYDNLWPLYSKSDTREISFPYNPAALSSRIQWMEAQAFRGKLGIGFSVRSGSRDHIDHAVVTGPNGFSYLFDLTTDYYDMSVETRLGAWGWGKEFILGTSSYGLYQLQVFFDDGYTETWQKQINPVAVVPVDVSTMRVSMLPDGAMTFSWGWPLGAGLQNYQVLVRGKDGKEYYRSSLLNSMTMHTAGPYDLRGLQPGKEYLWYVRAYDLNGNTVEQSGSLYFLYDPFVELLPGDLSGSGKVDLTDAIMAVQVIAGHEAKAVHSGRDVDGDGKIGLTEAIYILQQSAGLR